MDSEIFIDTRQLRQHALELGQTRQIAQRLSERLQYAGRLAEFSGGTLPDCRLMREKADELAAYYRRMGDALEEFCADAEAMSSGFGTALTDNVDRLWAALRRHRLVD